MASSTSSTPWPVLALHAMASVASRPDGLFNGFLGAQDVGRGQVDFVDDGNNLEAMVDGEIGVGQGLRFYALAGVDHQQCALAGCQRARDFVAEVHVAGVSMRLSW